jgi:hypothetical protein
VVDRRFAAIHAGDVDAYRATWYTKLRKGLKVTRAESTARHDALRPLLGAAAPPVVGFAVSELLGARRRRASTRVLDFTPQEEEIELSVDHVPAPIAAALDFGGPVPEAPVPGEPVSGAPVTPIAWAEAARALLGRERAPPSEEAQLPLAAQRSSG